MNKTHSQLKRVTISQPCQMSWNAMTGDERIRYCQQCDKHVHNFSAMTRDEIETLLMTAQGRLCARFERRSNGQLVTREISEPAMKRNFKLIPRASKMVATAMSAALSLGVNVVSGSAKVIRAEQIDSQ